MIGISLYFELRSYDSNKSVSLFDIAPTNSTRALLAQQPGVNALPVEDMSAGQQSDLFPRFMRFQAYATVRMFPNLLLQFRPRLDHSFHNKVYYVLSAVSGII